MELKVRSIGAVTQRILAQNQALVVLSITSRGVFLRTLDRIPSSWVLFLSTEEYRGPLTLNIEETLSGFPLESGFTLQVDGQNLYAQNLIVVTGTAAHWTASLPHLDALPAPECDQRFLEVARYLLARRSSGLLEEMLARHVEQRPTYGLQTLDAVELAHALQPYFGLGKGLTPSGDDLILGLLLIMNRWGTYLSPSLDLPLLNREVIQTAYQRTTTLSANLIECATTGQADERLILALDGLLTGEMETERCAAYLLSWGNSSGCDALAGMLAGFAGSRYLSQPKL